MRFTSVALFVVSLALLNSMACAKRGAFLVFPDVEQEASTDVEVQASTDVEIFSEADAASALDVRDLDAEVAFDVNLPDVESRDVEIFPDVESRVDAGAGVPLRTLFNTYYWKSVESDFDGAADTTLFDADCDPLAQVSADFSDAICIEGSGRLRDGRVLNFASRCNCGRACPTGGTICYVELDTERFPWGQGNRANPLVPLVSLAVDRDDIDNGTVIFLPEFAGLEIPVIGDVGGFVHDGCFRADDVGGLIRDDHIDIFTGTEDVRFFLEGVFPTRSTFDARVNAGRCAHLIEE